MSDLHMHYVCTREEARRLAAGAERFWIGICECRAARGTCARSRMDVCVEFRSPKGFRTGPGREATRAEVEGILREAEAKHLVLRPFRGESREHTAGLCVCCDDCCGYFLHADQSACDRGAYAERTDRDACSDCGQCAEVCFFGARKMAGGALAVDHESCYGCGLCCDVCPEDCIEMMPR